MSPSSSVHEARTMRMEFVQLVPGEEAALEAPPGEETAVLLISGDLEASSGRIGRPSVFELPLAGWFLPPGTELTAHAELPTTFAVVTTREAGLGEAGGEPVLLEVAKAERRGRGEWERSVITLVDAGCGSRRLIAGQTNHASGGWSSYPPHRHDGSGGEAYFEEIYHYRFDPSSGFGFQGIYGPDDLSEARLIEDGDTLTIERGYHPVCAAPEHRFTYLWALCGPVEHFQMIDDPAHSWLPAGG